MRLLRGIIFCITCSSILNTMVYGWPSIPTSASYALTSNVNELRVQINEEEPAGREVANLRFLIHGWSSGYKSDYPRGNFNFRLFNSDPQASYFLLDPQTGILKTARRIDRDQLCPAISTCCVHTLTSSETGEAVGQDSSIGCTLELHVRSDDQYTQIIHVHVFILDLNDNDPSWKHHFVSKASGSLLETSLEIKISESSLVGDSFTLPSARDPDPGIHGIVHYTLSPDLPEFVLQWESDFGSPESSQADRTPAHLPLGHELKLVVKRQLDREEREQYDFTLTAFDGGTPSRNRSINLKVLVTDANDNSPKFSMDTYEVELAENSRPHHPVVQVQAEDADIGANGQVKYRLSSLTKPEFARLFSIDPVSGWLSVQWEVDYEQYKKIQLTVEAIDNGHPPRASTCSVEIHVTDENDHTPEIRFEPAYLTNYAMVPENEPPGRLVAVFSATDSDSGDNGRVTCQLTEPKMWHFDSKQPEKLQTVLGDPVRVFFQLKQMHVPFSVMYKLISDTTFDHELTSRINVMILCTDHGKPRRNTTGTVAVRILDVNDVRPKFARSLFHHTVREDARVGTPLFNLNATDDDDGKNGEIKYWLSGADKDLFHVEENTGQVSIRYQLDRESQDKYHFMIHASDRGQPPLNSTAEVIVSVLDANDNAPQVNDRLEFNVLENHTAAEPLGKIEAIDFDIGKNAELIYSLLHCVAYSSNMSKSMKNMGPSECSHTFFVAKDGRIYLGNNRLDREEYDRYELTVRVEDHGVPKLTASATVIIRVNDVNDNSPRFLFPNSENSTIYVDRNSQPGTILTRILAIDDDTLENGDVIYELKSNENWKWGQFFYLHPTSGELQLRKSLSNLGKSYDGRNWENISKSNTFTPSNSLSDPVKHYMSHSSINLLFVASDNGLPQLKTTAILRILLNPPFHPPSQSLTSWNKTKGSFASSRSGQGSWSTVHSSLEDDLTGLGLLLGLVVIIGLFVCLLLLLIGSLVQHARFRRSRRPSDTRPMEATVDTHLNTKRSSFFEGMGRSNSEGNMLMSETDPFVYFTLPTQTEMC